METLNTIVRSLLFRIVVAIVLGIVCSWFFPEQLARVFVTFNGLFGNFLKFFIPVLIFSLITPAIAGIGKGAGKWLAITTAIAYASTIFAGLIAYGASVAFYPSMLEGERVMEKVDIDEGALSAYFSIEMPPPMGVLTALLLAFCIGVGMTAVKSDTLYSALRDLERVIMRVIAKFVIPLLPVFIFGVFLSMGMNGNLMIVLEQFLKVLLLAVVLTVLLLLVQFLIAGTVAGRNPILCFLRMLPAYATALGTSSSAATIPVTYECVKKNGVAPGVAGFAVPLCATIHLAGSMLKIGLFAFAVVYMAGIEVTAPQAIGFILMLGVTMIAAPGVPGGAIMAAVGLLTSMLGFDENQVALMIAAYIAIDSFGTACNVTGDGAISLVINKLAKGHIDRAALEDNTDGLEIIEQDVRVSEGA
ncbi:dicarboxylate/amino acid:cation symporter [Corynebacterium sp.]|uniref:dicarboxylate/amino acid:cation symporter n=1 Tax=Corynebacterium sp. TaxID=1720 RepID=UPI0026DBA221|nr:dicarboxylate/amino acid:cation symporter [Corynebacterium sp.]MDO5077602.1 dicarboxylate/amino acid:cation symporter [Corynebacterium sp.]